jgi:hypothetical protein
LKNDVFGIPIEIGDIVAFRDSHKNYDKLKIGKIVKFTKSGAIIEELYNSEKIHRSFEYIIRYEEQYNTNQEKYPEYFI